MEPQAERQEQRLLLLSAAATLTLSLLGVAIGLLSGAKSIVFDGVYSLADAGLTMVAFYAARLIARGADRRFQYGYWHIEPMLGFVNGSVLLLACIYAFIDGVDTVLMGGREVSFGPGIVYAAASAAICVAMHLYVRRRSRGLGSSLLQLDARAWLFSGLLNAGLSLAFLVAVVLEGTRAEPLAMYFDPAILIILAIAMAPLPLRTLIGAGREVLQIAPADLDAHVSLIAGQIAARHGFVAHQSYVTRVGRAQFVEIGFVGASPEVATTLGDLDAIRTEVAEAMGGLNPGYWLTIQFTADRQWI
jgi:predicted Co/Zn/Cd cation transporter (cation efflux family)